MAQTTLLKVMLLGDSSVGKSSLMKRYVDGGFDPRYRASIGVEFMFKNMNIDGNDVRVQIWDTAGQERFMSLGSAHFRGSDACILVYDITSTESFSHLNSWMEEFTNQTGKKNFVLMGNKSDLEDKRAVTSRTAQTWCQKNGEDFQYFETSAKESVGVEDAFKHIVEKALKVKLEEQKKESVETGPTINLNDRKPKNKKKEKDCPC